MTRTLYWVAVQAGCGFYLGLVLFAGDNEVTSVASQRNTLLEIEIEVCPSTGADCILILEGHSEVKTGHVVRFVSETHCLANNEQVYSFCRSHSPIVPHRYKYSIVEHLRLSTIFCLSL